MSGIKINYDSEGDILDVIFSISIPKRRTAIELNDNIILFMDIGFKKAIGLTVLSYSKLLQKRLKFDLDQLPGDRREKLTKLLLKSPINLILDVRDDTLKIHATHLEELIAAWIHLTQWPLALSAMPLFVVDLEKLEIINEAIYPLFGSGSVGLLLGGKYPTLFTV